MYLHRLYVPFLSYVPIADCNELLIRRGNTINATLQSFLKKIPDISQHDNAIIHGKIIYTHFTYHHLYSDKFNLYN